MLKIATIIVTYNAERWIKRCIDSISNSSLSSDIFLVDNASTDQTMSVLHKEKCYEIITLDKNYGFGYANNLALKEALMMGFDYFFLVNQDVYIEQETLVQLTTFLEKNPTVGIACPIQYNGKGEKIDFLFDDYISKSLDKGEYFETHFANAAAWLISKKCLEKVGYFHALFPHYGEDVNYCNRAEFHEFKIAILKDTKVLHDRNQAISLEKSIALSKIKLLTIFLNPNYSEFKSLTEAIKNVFGIAKYIIKKHKKSSTYKSFPILAITFFKYLLKLNELTLKKNLSKNPFS